MTSEDGDPEVRGLEELLQAMDAESLGGIEDRLQDAVSATVSLEPGGAVSTAENGETVETDGIDLHVDVNGVLLEYPFHVSDLWEELFELDAMHRCYLAWRQIEEEVRAVEGFRVVVTDWPARLWKDRSQKDAYPYRSAAPGSLTVAAWRDQRFRRHHRSHEVLVRLPDGGVAAGNTRLSSLRRLWELQDDYSTQS